MSDLYADGRMHWFLKLIVVPLLDALGPKVIVEVGIEVGAVTRPLLNWASEHDALLHCIDPDPNLNIDELVVEYGEHLRFHQTKSLTVLGELQAVDIALIDGDHNWYTVINELRALERRALEDDRRPPVVLAHDVGWPYGRRDLYYDPQAIPGAHRQPHARMGIRPDRSELGPGLNDHLENALLDNTPANGVLSAVEDFVAESEVSWRLYSLPGLSGLAILSPSSLQEENPAVGAVLASLDTPQLLRAQCEAIELARIDSELKRAAMTSRLAEAQLKQVMQRVDPEELVALYKRVRELEEDRRELETRVGEGEEAQAQVRLLLEKLSTPATEHVGLPTAPAPAAALAELAAAESEREARKTFLDQFLPTLEEALPERGARDPLALPSLLSPSSPLTGEGEQEAAQPSVDVVVCVHDALEDLRLCLWSLTHKTHRRFRLIVVDDGSAEETSEYLDALAARVPELKLIRRAEPPHGYTLAANAGLSASRGDYVVLLNSDTVVSHEWLERIVSYGQDHERVGILGPLSNAASHQSLPELRRDGKWAVNTLPDWLTVDGAGLAIQRDAPRVHARLPFLNGFCYTIKRAAIDAVGLFDEESFPDGYCEENDYSQRARDAGFELAVVDDAYVYHAKSRSFGAAGREELARRNYEIFRSKHGSELIDGLVREMESDATLAPVRAAFARRTSEPAALRPLLAETGQGPLSIVFVLPGLPFGGSGGSHSVYQEVKGLRTLGVPARVALPRWDWDRAMATYADADDVFQAFADTDDLAEATADADVISATHYKSVAILKSLRERREDFLAAYYVQDYEPFFTPPYVAEEAIASYTALPDMLLFAKSYWLCNVVGLRHGLSVAKVEPSIDKLLFRAGQHSSASGALRVAAMLRPRTARRQPHSTIAVLKRLLAGIPSGSVEITTFGCYTDELREIAPDEDAIVARHRGLLSREDVAEVLRSCDVFLDMSVYQAFGRTALEAMACGCTAVAPAVGGVWEFLEDGSNGFAVDTLDPDRAFEALHSLATDRAELERLKTGALRTAARYSIPRAALSEYLTFERAHKIRFGDLGQTPASSLPIPIA